MYDQKRNSRSNGNGGQERPRAQLRWEEVEKFNRGSTVGTVNRAERPDGSLIYSWCIGKEGRNDREGQVLKFCDPRDFQDAHDILEDMDEWIDDDRKRRR